jgi:hypothetical protein
MTAIRQKLQPGMRVRVRQVVRGRNEVWTTDVEGEVVRCFTKRTGSWYAHGRDGRLWLDRLQLRKDDGELTTLNLDAESEVAVLEPAAA